MSRGSQWPRRGSASRDIGAGATPFVVSNPCKRVETLERSIEVFGNLDLLHTDSNGGYDMEKLNGIHALPIVPLDEKEPHLETKNLSAITPVGVIADARCKPRFKLQVDMTINSRTCGVLAGRSVDISESGMASMLRIEAPLGEVVELGFTLPCGPVTIYAMVRQR